MAVKLLLPPRPPTPPPHTPTPTQGTLVAVKLLLAVDGLARQRFSREVALLAGVRHPNLLLFMGYCTRPYLAIVSE